MICSLNCSTNIQDLAKYRLQAQYKPALYQLQNNTRPTEHTWRILPGRYTALKSYFKCQHMLLLPKRVRFLPVKGGETIIYFRTLKPLKDEEKCVTCLLRIEHVVVLMRYGSDGEREGVGSTCCLIISRIFTLHMQVGIKRDEVRHLRAKCPKQKPHAQVSLSLALSLLRTLSISLSLTHHSL